MVGRAGRSCRGRCRRGDAGLVAREACRHGCAAGRHHPHPAGNEARPEAPAVQEGSPARSGRTPTERTATTAAGITRWRFVFNNQGTPRYGQRFRSAFVSYRGSKFGKITGARSPFVEDLKHPEAAEDDTQDRRLEAARGRPSAAVRERDASLAARGEAGPRAALHLRLREYARPVRVGRDEERPGAALLLGRVPESPVAPRVPPPGQFSRTRLSRTCRSASSRCRRQTRP